MNIYLQLKILVLVALMNQVSAQQFGTIHPPHTPGASGVPYLTYNDLFSPFSNYGVLTLHTRGTTVRSIRFTSPPIEHYLSGGGVFPTTENADPWGWVMGSDGVFRGWTNTYNVDSGTSEWRLGIDISNSGLNGEYQIALYPLGMTGPGCGGLPVTDGPWAHDFGYAEIGETIDGTGQTWYTAVQRVSICPEPTSSLIFIASFFAFGLDRTRRRRNYPA